MSKIILALILRIYIHRYLVNDICRIGLEKDFLKISKVGTFCYQQNRHSIASIEECKMAARAFQGGDGLFTGIEDFPPGHCHNPGCYYRFVDDAYGTRKFYWAEFPPVYIRTRNDYQWSNSGEICYSYSEYLKEAHWKNMSI